MKPIEPRGRVHRIASAPQPTRCKHSAERSKPAIEALSRQRQRCSAAMVALFSLN